MAAATAKAGGAGIGAVGSLIQGQAQANALDRAAQIEQQNAALDIETGDRNAAISAIHSDKRIGSMVAGYGASGVSSDSGSVLAELASSEANAELDRQNIMHGAKVRAINYENQASMDQVGAKSALQGSYMNAFGTLLGGGAQAFGQSAGVSPGSYQATKGNAGSGFGSAGGGDANPDEETV